MFCVRLHKWQNQITPRVLKIGEEGGMQSEGEEPRPCSLWQGVNV